MTRAQRIINSNLKSTVTTTSIERLNSTGSNSHTQLSAPITRRSVLVTPSGTSIDGGATNLVPGRILTDNDDGTKKLGLAKNANVKTPTIKNLMTRLMQDT